MRRAFVDALVELATRDESIVLLTGDLGFTVLEPFAERFPDRFFNVGVAEQNMVGLAAGLAATGFTPYVYSIATFASMRPYELLRNGPILHQLPVRVVGVGGGFDYGHDGPTHYALEDVGIMRAQPELAIAAPADPAQVTSTFHATAGLAGPIYYRLGKGSATAAGLDGRFRLGRLEQIGAGTDLAIVTYGSITIEVIEAADRLEAAGLSPTVAVAACLAPAPVDDLVELCSRVPVALTVETHYVHGGVGSLVCEVVAEHGLACRVVRLGLSTMPRASSGSAAYLHDRFGLSARHVADAGVAACAAADRALTA